MACVRRGRARLEADRAILLSAHYDHLGVGVPNADGDSIYNGFADNAEEAGLIGADYFATHPPWPLTRITGVINLDANVPAAPPRSWRIAGIEESSLVELVRDEAQRHGWEATIAPPSPASDHYPFIRHGVPAAYVVPDDGPYEGVSLTASDSLRSVLWGRYHTPDDTWDERFRFDGLERYAEFILAVIRRMDADYGASSVMSRTGPGGRR